MDHAFWHGRWGEGRIGFHQPDGDPRLPRRWAALDAREGRRVFVPLCGKSRDMVWLAERGHRVLGVELSPIAARDFFAESGFPCEVARRGPFEAWQSTRPDRDVTILVGDVFDLEADILGEVGAVYDRAATVALPTLLRERYARHIGGFLAPGVETLLITMEYDQERMEGPPFSVPDEAVRALFAPWHEIELLEEECGPDVVGGLRAKGLETLTERAYRLRRR